MKRLAKTVAMGAILFLIAAPAGADSFPQPRVDYSATTQMTSKEKGATESLTGRIYQAGKKLRYEWLTGQGKEKSIIIFRRDKGVSWILMPGQRQYFEASLKGDDDDEEGEGGSDFFNPEDFAKGEFKMTQVGTESVSGVRATKYKFTAADEDERSSGLMWLTKDGILVKMAGQSVGEGGEREDFEYALSNLKIGKQARSLFEIPKGYTRFEIPSFGGAMGRGHSMGGRGGEPPSEQEAEAMKKQMEEMMKQMQQQQMGGSR